MKALWVLSRKLRKETKLRKELEQKLEEHKRKYDRVVERFEKIEESVNEAEDWEEYAKRVALDIHSAARAVQALKGTQGEVQVLLQQTINQQARESERMWRIHEADIDAIATLVGYPREEPDTPGFFVKSPLAEIGKPKE